MNPIWLVGFVLSSQLDRIQQSLDRINPPPPTPRQIRKAARRAQAAANNTFGHRLRQMIEDLKE